VKYTLRKTREFGPFMGRAIISTHYGFKMELQLHDWVDQHIWASGNYEDSTALTIETLLNRGDVCIDLGAHIGFFTLLMAQCVGSEGAVWAFEPSPQVRTRLLRNLALNRVNNVTVREEAVAEVEGKRIFCRGPDDHSSLGSLRSLKLSKGSFEVRTCRLSSCLPGSLWPRLIKMDIEGAEYLALQGMSELLRDQHPDIILEISNHFLTEMGSSSVEIYSFMRQFGYHMYRIDWDGLIAYQRWDSSLPTQFNALFTMREFLPRQLNLKAVVM
jgi:FkbM family methyltransferase